MNKKEITHTTFSNFIEELKPQFDDAKMTSYCSQTYYETEETNGAVLGFSIDLNGTEKTKKGEYERHLYIEFTCIDSTEKCYIKTIDTTYRKIYHFENGKTRFSQKLSIDTQPNELQKRVADIVLFVETIVLAYLKEIDKENEENKTTDELIEEQITNKEILTILGIEESRMEDKELLPIIEEFKKLASAYNPYCIWLKGDYGIYVKGEIVSQTENLIVVVKINDFCSLSITDFKKLYPNGLETNQSGRYVNLPQTKFLVCHEDETYTAVDNTTQDFWCEDFKTKEDAIKWLNNEDL